VRLLAGHGLEYDTLIARRAACANELVAMGVPSQRRARPSVLVRRADVRRTLEREQRGTDEEQRPDERRYRVTGKAEDERCVAHTEGEGLPRLDGYAPEKLLDSELGLDAADEVVRPHRHAAGRHEHVRS
jgi:hypothetical protein